MYFSTFTAILFIELKSNNIFEPSFLFQMLITVFSYSSYNFIKSFRSIAHLIQLKFRGFWINLW